MAAPPSLLRREGADGRAPPAARRWETRRRFAASEHFTGWAFATPAAVIILLFGAVPIVWSIILSFQHVSLGPGGKFVGLSNYREMAHDPVVRQAIGHTFVYTA